MKDYIIRLNKDMDQEIEQKMLQKHIIISWQDSLLPDIVFVQTNVDQVDLEKLEFVHSVEIPRIMKTNI